MAERRRQYYTDQILQGYFLVGLILLEILLVILLVYYLHIEVDQILEDQMYQIHKTDQNSFPEIFRLILVALASFVAANIVALYVAHIIWGRYIKNTITIFSLELDKISALDFTPVNSSRKTHHHMIGLMDDWMLKEKNRISEINVVLKKLEQFGSKENKATQSDNIIELLDEYRSLLPARKLT